MGIIARFRKFDWILFTCFLLLGGASLLILGSSNVILFWRQFIGYVLAIFIILLGSQINWRRLIGQQWVGRGLYWLSVLLLIIAHLQRTMIRGTKSWIVFNGFQYEPVELAKLALILIFANFFSRRHIGAWQGKNIFISFLYAALPILLVLWQPDLGSALVLFVIWAGFLLVSGVHWKRLLIGVTILLLTLALFWFLALKPYQKDRILAFIFPEKDPLGINYNVIQSKIAIGSAGLFGKGFGAGTEVQLHFLPAAQTDFIFAAFTEEWGLIGAYLIILTFLVIIYRFMIIGLGARDNYAAFIVFGAGLFIAIHFLINVGSNLGLVPVTGITFPFFSYGGSNLLTTAILIAIIEYIKIESG